MYSVPLKYKSSSSSSSCVHSFPHTPSHKHTKLHPIKMEPFQMPPPPLSCIHRWMAKTEVIRSDEDSKVKFPKCFWCWEEFSTIHTLLVFSAARGQTTGPLSRDELTDMMSHILKGQGGDLLPVLQGVCGQVTKLRLDDAAEEKMRNGSWWVLPLRSSHYNGQLL